MVHMPAKYVAELTAIRDSLEEIRREAAEGAREATRLENIHDGAPGRVTNDMTELNTSARALIAEISRSLGRRRVVSLHDEITKTPEELKEITDLILSEQVKYFNGLLETLKRDLESARKGLDFLKSL
jgi:hypothetical protein